MSIAITIIAIIIIIAIEKFLAPVIWGKLINKITNNNSNNSDSNKNKPEPTISCIKFVGTIPLSPMPLMVNVSTNVGRRNYRPRKNIDRMMKDKVRDIYFTKITTLKVALDNNDVNAAMQANEDMKYLNRVLRSFE